MAGAEQAIVYSIATYSNLVCSHCTCEKTHGTGFLRFHRLLIGWLPLVVNLKRLPQSLLKLDAISPAHARPRPILEHRLKLTVRDRIEL